MTDITLRDPESVLEVGRMLDRLADKILDVQTEISRAADEMDWTGSAKDYFRQDVEIWAGKMYALSQKCTEKGSAVTREEEEWETAAAKFGWGAEGYTPFLIGDKDGSAADKTDIHQGGYNDCFLMSSLGSIALNHPEVLEDMIEVLPDGRYKVRFYDKFCLTPFGPCTYVAHYVIVDMDFSSKAAWPMDKSGGSQEAWTMIIEKAYSQWQRERTLLGDPTSLLPSPAVALSAITGKDCVNYITPTMSMDDLYQKFQRGDAITAGSDWKQNPNRPPAYFEATSPDQPILTEGHVYFITNVDPVNNTVTLQNPWGPQCPPITMPFEDYQKCFWLTTTNPVE
jgi:Calpain family cysteine protease